jgi:hypothetical protein
MVNSTTQDVGCFFKESVEFRLRDATVGACFYGFDE